MSNITDVTKIPGFNQQQYTELIQQAETRHVTAGEVDASLLAAVNAGKSFTEALQIATSELPKLSPPDSGHAKNLSNWTSMLSPGALIMALITENAAEQRLQNRQLAWAETEAVVDSMHEQADGMRKMAGIQLAMGICSAVTSIAGGIAQGAVAGTGGKGLTSGANMALSAKAQGIGTGIGGGAKIFESVGQYIGTVYQADFKGMEADQERTRATRDSLRDLNDSLNELIHKTLSGSESIAQGFNQTTARILA